MAKRDTGINPGEHELTPEQLEQVERLRQQTAEYLEKNPIPDEYVGKSPAQIEERDALADARADRAANTQTVEMRREIALLREELAENQATLKKMAQEKGGYSAATEAIVRMEAAKERQDIYRRIRDNGGFCTIVIHTHEDPAQNWDVDVSVNEMGLKIKRGVQTVVPASFVEVLDHAKVDAWVKEIDEQGNPRHVRHERLSYPYTLIDYNGRAGQAGMLRRAA